jgi:threonine aldolase
VIDLRSDTATRPSAAMRRAMAEAEVGDEQRQEDPTVNALEERAAAFLGQETAVFLPTATMANQIALKVLTEPGDEVIAEAGCHIFRSELGGAAFHSGLAMKAVHGERGIFGPDDVRAAMWTGDIHQAPTRLVCVENTHNSGGGKVWPLEHVRAVVAEARGLGLAVHLDGSRLANAAVAAGIPAAEFGRSFDTVTLCLSKGLGCPLGALLAGSAERMTKARRLKHLFGGAMRQAGVVAAAGLYALEHNVARLADDHLHAKRLAEGLAEAGLPVDPVATESNFVVLDASAIGLTVEETTALLAAEGVLFSAAGRPGRLRALTHLDISAADVEQAIDGATRALATAAAA